MNGLKPLGDSGGLYQFSLDQYHRMISAGILHEGARDELLEGYIVLPEQQTPPYYHTRQAVRELLVALVPDGWRVRLPAVITLAESDSEPEPDLCIVRGRGRDYATRHPYPEDVGLVVEVSLTALHLDRHAKKRIYARACIVEYWIVNLVDRQVEVHTQPSGDAYATRWVYRSGDTVPLALEGVSLGAIAVDDMLP